MKLIIRDYLSSLREREELDAILPDLLSEIGFTVYSRPARGTTQYGVDVAAVGTDDDGTRKVFLFSIKQGDLTRQEWHAPLQGLRSSLDEIRDAYIPTRIPERYRSLKIVICLCFGGDMQEQVRPLVRGYTSANTTDRVSYDEWNGDRIAGLIERGILREKVLPQELRSAFQKAVAMVDEPDIAYYHFSHLVKRLSTLAEKSARARVRSARQIYVCLWVLYVWARDAKNIESAYRASELSVLNIWALIRPLLQRKGTDLTALGRVLDQSIQLYLTIASQLLEIKILPTCEKRHALSMAVDARSHVDVNLKLFDLIGRLGLFGLWLKWLAERRGAATESLLVPAQGLMKQVVQIIAHNPALGTPLCDEQVIDISLVALLAVHSNEGQADIANWLHNIVANVDHAYRFRGHYPTVLRDYGELLEHPKDRTLEYMQSVTPGSILLPFLASWAAGLQDQESFASLRQLKADLLKHCTFQAWLPDEESEQGIYIGDRDHGLALTDLPLTGDGRDMLKAISTACAENTAFAKLSALSHGLWPLVLMACRHYRSPVPPQFWISAFETEG